HRSNITFLAKFFTSICMATSFLSVSLSLSDFLSDGFRIKKEGVKGNSLVFGATFIPPLAIVLFYPNAFLTGLEFAGLSVFILMILLPPLMTWMGRYRKEFSNNYYQSAMTKPVLLFLILFAVFMLLISGNLGQVAFAFIATIFIIGFFV